MRGSGFDFLEFWNFHVRVLIQPKFSSKSYYFSHPYPKQDLQIIFSECSENCEDQPCVAKCQRDFYINIDCKP